MWSGSLLNNYSGSITGAHQRINRFAYKNIRDKKPNSFFPSIKDILYFEGKNGPDGIKAKSPSKDEPWHFFNPYDISDHDVTDFISMHFDNLVLALRDKNKQRAAFEAAWLAHAVVDGLTPAHHYPYEEELELLRGEPRTTRSTIKQKIIIPGSTKVEMIKKNWKMWGAKGIFTTHGTFELGVAMILMSIKKNDIYKYMARGHIKRNELTDYYRKKAVHIANKNLYKIYYKRGWNIKLTREVRTFLLPNIIAVVSDIWLSAIEESLNSKKI